MKIYYYDVKYRVRDWRKIKSLIIKVISENKYKPGDLNYIVTNDKEIQELNKKYLKHDYPTDVLSFRYSKGQIIDGEIFISIETVKRNSKIYKTTVKNELLRVIIHGTLHLCGFKDRKKAEKEIMRKAEDYWLKYIKY